MVGRMARLKTLKDIGGLKLVCLKVLDRLMNEDKVGERLYNICESAKTVEYPDLLEKLFKYYGGGYRQPSARSSKALYGEDSMDEII